MKYIKLFIVACCILASVSKHAQGQVHGNPSTSTKFVIKNDELNTITLAPPATGVTNYTLTLPPAVGGTGSMLTGNATGNLSWLPAGANGQVLTITGGVPTWGNGTQTGLTSVGLQMPSVLYSSVTNSPLTSNGILIPQLAVQNAKKFFAGPTSGADATPSFRLIQTTDLPTDPGSYILNGTSLQNPANFNIKGNGEIGGLLKLNGSTSGTTTFQASATGANLNYTLPATGPAANSILYSSGGSTSNLSWSAAGTNGQILTITGGVPTWSNGTTGVTSVGLSMPSIFNVTNSPVTSTGTLTASLNTQAANLVFAGPTTGAPATPTFRALSTVDFPPLPYVSSVGLQMPSVLYSSVTNSPITTSGTLIPQLATQNAKKVFIGPVSGADATPTFRLLQLTDLPTGIGTVTSVGLAMPSIFTVTNSPVTTAGTLTATLNIQTAATVFAGPITGAAATPTFRALVASDIPPGSGYYIQNTTSQQPTSNFNISGSGTIGSQLKIAGSGSGMSTFQAPSTGATVNYTLPGAQGAASTYLQNDGSGALSWVDINSQIGGIKFARKSSDETINNSSTLQDDDDLYFTIGANETWELIAQLDADNGSTSAKMKVAVTIPSGTIHVYAKVADNDANDSDDAGWLTSSGGASPNFELNGSDEKGPIMLQGLIVGGSTGGTVKIRWAPDTSSSSTVVVHTNSYLKATRVQ